MAGNTFGQLFTVTSFGESHGPALGCVVDGCPPGVPIDEAMIQQWLDKRKPGQNKYTTQRREADEVKMLSGICEGVTTGTPVQLMIDLPSRLSLTATVGLRRCSAALAPRLLTADAER